MPDWRPLEYQGFWDVPRVIIVRQGQGGFVLESPFEEALDDYRPTYGIYWASTLPDPVPQAFWALVPEIEGLSMLGFIEVQQVRFDPSRRKEIDWETVGFEPKG